MCLFYILQGDDNCDDENNSCSTGDDDDNRNMSNGDNEDNTDDDKHRESGSSYRTYYIEFTIYIYMGFFCSNSSACKDYDICTTLHWWLDLYHHNFV